MTSLRRRPFTTVGSPAAGFALVLVVVAASLVRAEATTDAEAPKEDDSRAWATEVERPWRPPTLTSGLGIPAGETFHLGERPTGDFIVSAKNRGETQVTLFTLRGKRRQRIATLAPGETAVRAFRSGDGVLLRNESASRGAKLKVEAWGTRNLAMYYTPNDALPEERDDD